MCLSWHDIFESIFFHGADTLRVVAIVTWEYAINSGWEFSGKWSICVRWSELCWPYWIFGHNPDIGVKAKQFGERPVVECKAQ